MRRWGKKEEKEEEEMRKEGRKEGKTDRQTDRPHHTHSMIKYALSATKLCWPHGKAGVSFLFKLWP